MTILPLETLLGALRHGPCNEHWDRVRKEWPDGIPLHESTFVVANALGLDLVWLDEQLDHDDERVEEAWVSHQRSASAAYEDYVTGQIGLDAFNTACDTTWRPYCDLRNAAILAHLRTLVKS